VGPRALLLTALALLCFAGNSILCRLALAGREIDATSFVAIRLGSGALVLAVLARPRKKDTRPRSARWLSAALLFGYAAPFSYAYLVLGAGLGALILFAAVQITMLGWGVIGGERPPVVAWVGITLAVLGLVGLVVPGKGAPDLAGTAAMALAGVAWGAYSLRGRAVAGDPLVTTATSFMYSLPFTAVLVATVAPFAGAHASYRGALLAATSGALASGLGYSIWYAALPHLSATRAAAVQLLVPVIAAFGAVVLLGEMVSIRLVVTSAVILSGVGLTIRARSTEPRMR
jgi:drug/metabolite transporter (DMT)-like permease